MLAVKRPATALLAAATMVLAGVSTTTTPSAAAALDRKQPTAAAPTSHGSGAQSPGSHRSVVERLTQQAGIQLGAKHTDRPTVKVGGRRYPAPDPMVSHQLSGTTTDLFYWRRQHRLAALQRMRARATAGAARAVPRPFVYHEREAMGAIGRNDGSSTSEQLVDLGTDRPFQAARVEGRLSAPPVRARRGRTREDQGSIYRATPSGIGRAHPRVVIASRIGDGPHGKSGDGRGDFDFFRVHAFARSAITADTWGSKVDTVLVVYDSSGHVVAANDDVEVQDEDDEEMLTSALEYNVRRTGDYFVMVGGFSDAGSVPANPFRSGSGRQAGDEGRYRLRVTARPVDRDLYGVQLHSGDLLGGVLTGSAESVQVIRADGHGMVASEQDDSAAYPATSPLPGGGATFAYVAEQPGWYAVSARNGAGAYRLLLETYRAGTTGAGQQTVFLDFGGARINTAMFGGQGVTTLSPMKTFLPRWRLPNRQLDALVHATDAAVTENIDATLRARGLNKTLSVRVLNSRDDADPFGQPGVSRVVVGGTIRQAGVPTIGVAGSIDPGNYAHEESALVLLDELSRPAGAEDSLNTLMRPGSNRVAFIGRALGDVVSHEAGHLLGSFHTDNHDNRVNLMDSGGGSLGRSLGVGPDKVGGTADDVDVNFGEDVFAPDEGFHGLQNTLNNSAWGFVTP